MRRVGVSFIAAAAVSLPVTAWAQPTSLSLTWDAPGGCPDALTVLRRVSALRASDHPSAPLRATATVTRDGRRWRVRIETPDGARSLGAPRCASLAEATAVVLALALDDAAPAPAVPPARPTLPPEVEQLTDAELPPVLRPTPPVVPPPPPRARWELGARAVIDANALVDTGFGALVALSWQRRGLRLELAPTFVYASREVASPQAASLEAMRVSLATRLCAATPRGPGVGLCALVDLGWLRARGAGFSLPGDGNAPWIAAGISVFARFGGVRAPGIVALDAALPITRPRFVVQGTDAGWQVPAITLALSVGMSFEM